jgi:hypothetical protein
MPGMSLLERDSHIPATKELQIIAASVQKEILTEVLLEPDMARRHLQCVILSSDRALAGMGEQPKTRRKHTYAREHPSSLIEA